MKDFYDMAAQVEAKNKEQRMFLAQSLQPFFNALSQKAAYNEQYARSLKEEEDRNIKFGESVKEYQATGVVPTNAPIALQSIALQNTENERIRREDLINKSQQAGFGEQMAKMLKEKPDMDIDNAWGEVSKLLTDKQAEDSASMLGTKYLGEFNKLRDGGATTQAALGEVMRKAERDDAIWKNNLNMQSTYASQAYDWRKTQEGWKRQDEQLAQERKDALATNLTTIKANKDLYKSGQVVKVTSGKKKVEANVSVIDREAFTGLNNTKLRSLTGVFLTVGGKTYFYNPNDPAGDQFYTADGSKLKKRINMSDLSASEAEAMVSAWSQYQLLRTQEADYEKNLSDFGKASINDQAFEAALKAQGK